jgi:hypothetical protein
VHEVLDMLNIMTPANFWREEMITTRDESKDPSFEKGKTPYEYAQLKNHTNIMPFLLEHSVDKVIAEAREVELMKHSVLRETVYIPIKGYGKDSNGDFKKDLVSNPPFDVVEEALDFMVDYTQQVLLIAGEATSGMTTLCEQLHYSMMKKDFEDKRAATKVKDSAIPALCVIRVNLGDLTDPKSNLFRESLETMGINDSKHVRRALLI